MGCPKINVLAFHPAGSQLAAGGGDFLNQGMIVLWPLKNK